MAYNYNNRSGHRVPVWDQSGNNSYPAQTQSYGHAVAMNSANQYSASGQSGNVYSNNVSQYQQAQQQPQPQSHNSAYQRSLQEFQYQMNNQISSAPPLPTSTPTTTSSTDGYQRLVNYEEEARRRLALLQQSQEVANYSSQQSYPSNLGYYAAQQPPSTVQNNVPQQWPNNYYSFPGVQTTQPLPPGSNAGSNVYMNANGVPPLPSTAPPPPSNWNSMVGGVPSTPVGVPPPPIQEPKPVEPAKEKEPPKAAKKAVPIMVGKRRGGRVLPTGMVKKNKSENNEHGKKDAWSQYMAEVRRYKEQSCEEEGKNRPLVK